MIDNIRTESTRYMPFGSHSLFMLSILESVIVELFLRRTKDRSPRLASECPGMPYFTGFLTNVSVRISLQYTP